MSSMWDPFGLVFWCCVLSAVEFWGTYVRSVSWCHVCTRMCCVCAYIVECVSLPTALPAVEVVWVGMV